MFFVDADSYYTWHNHEAEELYFVLSGSAKFESKSDESKTLISLPSTTKVLAIFVQVILFMSKYLYWIKLSNS